MNQTNFKFIRGASPGVGQDYEKFVTALIAARLFYYSSKNEPEKEFDDFELGINLKNMGKFDDLVILLKKNQHLLKNIAVQLKHKERGTLTDTMLSANEGNFSLKVYRKSALSDVKLPIDQYVLYTNLPFNPQTILNDYQIKQSDNNEVLSFLNTSSSNNVFNFISTTNSFSENEHFFQKFSVYANQKNVSEVEQELHQTLREKFSADEHAQKVFIELCSHWCNDIDVKDIVPHKPKLDRKEIGKILAVCLLKPFLVTLQPPIEYQAQWKVLTKVSTNFTVTVIDCDVCKNWTSAPLKENDFSIWTENCIEPLVVKIFEPRQSNQVLQGIHILKEIGLMKNLIVVGPLETKNIDKEIRIFKNLNNLDKNFLEEVLTEFNISSETLSNFFGNQIKVVLDKVTPSSLFNIVCNTKKEPNEELPECYLLRSFEVPIIYDVSVILNIFENNIVVLLTEEPDSLKTMLKNIIQTENMNRKEEKEECDKNNFNNIKIIKTPTTINQQTFYNILNNYPNTNVHIFKQTNANDQKLELISSNGPNIQLLKDPTLKQINENVLASDVYNKINILCAEPGMGKTTTLKMVHNQLTSQNCYSKFISFKDHSRFFKNFNSSNASIESILKYFLKIQNNADLVKLYYLNTGRVCLLFDAIDELDSQYLNNAIECVNKLLQCSAYTFKVWISTRKHLKDQLENIYKVHALDIRIINESDQKEYIKNRLIHTHLESDIKNVITNIYDNLKSFEQNIDIYGTPLHIYILTEVLLDYDLNTDINNLLVLSKLYHEFFEGKLHYVQDKRVKLSNYSEFYDLDKFEIAALKVCLDQGDFEQLNIENYTKCIQNIKDSLIIGIVTSFSNDDIPNFYHQSFAEYLCASYFTKNVDSNPILKHLIFKPKYNAIRLFFNMKLSEDSPFQCAIIYQNIDALKDAEIDQIKSSKDQGGRNLLQLAISCGQNYPLWTLKNNIYKEPIEISINSKLEDIIKLLIDYFDCEEKDELFEWSSYEFAVNMNDLSLINIILDYKPNNLLLQDYCLSKKESILGYSAKYGFMNLIKILCSNSSIDFVNEIKFNLLHHFYDKWCTAIHLAIENDQFVFVNFLINNNADINSEDSIGNTPLCYVVLKKHNTKYVELFVSKGGHIKKHSVAQRMLNFFAQEVELIKFLQEHFEEHQNSKVNFNDAKGVTPLHWTAFKGQLQCLKQHITDNINNINSKDLFGYSPLDWAIFGGELECLQELIANGADVNSTNSNNISPLHLATFYNQFECLKELIANGADVNFKWFNNATALNFCIVRGNRLEFLQELIANGAEINSQNSDGLTPLHLAAQSKNLECLKELIVNGADIDCKNLQGASPLYEAAFNGHLQSLKELIANGADVNFKDSNGATPLHNSALAGHLECVQELIALGAEINAKDLDDITPLHSAILRKQLPCIQELIAKGADVNAKDSDHRTPLSSAAFYGGLLQCMPDLIAKGADINAKDSNGFTSLHLATQEGHLHSLQKLISLGAEVNSKNLEGITPLHIAAKKGHLQSLQELIAKGADVNAKDVYNRTPLFFAGFLRCIEDLIYNGAEINAKDSSGFTPLHVATQEGHVESLQKLIDLGAEVNYKNSDGFTSLHLTATVGQLQCLQKLITLGAEVNSKTANEDTPLHLAAMKGHLEILRELIALGAEINSKNSEGYTPLHLAAIKDHFQCLQELIVNGSEVNSKDLNGYTPLHYAAQNGYLKCQQELIAKNADLNLKNTQGFTPVHVATICGHLQSLQELIAKDAEINSKNSYGCTPLHSAAFTGHFQCLQELIAKSAEVNSKDLNGFTPLHFAAHKGHLQCLQELIAKCAEVNSRNSNGYTPLDITQVPECRKALIASGAK